MTGQGGVLPWLATDGLRAQVSTDRTKAVGRYVQFVGEGVGEKSIWKDLNRQIFLGDDCFVARASNNEQELAEYGRSPAGSAASAGAAPDGAGCGKPYRTRDQTIVAAYTTGEYSYQEITNFFGLHFTTVGKTVRAARNTHRKVS